MSTQFADSSDHESLVISPKSHKNRQRVDVITQKLRHEQTKQLIYQYVAFVWLGHTQSKKKIFWCVLKRVVKDVSDLSIGVRVRQDNKSFD